MNNFDTLVQQLMEQINLASTKKEIQSMTSTLILLKNLAEDKRKEFEQVEANERQLEDVKTSFQQSYSSLKKQVGDLENNA